MINNEVSLSIKEAKQPVLSICTCMSVKYTKNFKPATKSSHSHAQIRKKKRRSNSLTAHFILARCGRDTGFGVAAIQRMRLATLPQLESHFLTFYFTLTGKRLDVGI